MTREHVRGIVQFLGISLNWVIQRLHRLGSLVKACRYAQTIRRPIIVAFRDFTDSEYILGQAYKLLGTRFGTDRDYPQEIANTRQSLWKQYKYEKQDPRANVKPVYPAKLIVNGKCIADEFPYIGFF